MDDQSSDTGEGSALGHEGNAMQGGHTRAVFGNQHSVVGAKRGKAALDVIGGSGVAQLAEQLSDDSGVLASGATNHATEDRGSCDACWHHTAFDRAPVSGAAAVVEVERFRVPQPASRWTILLRRGTSREDG